MKTTSVIILFVFLSSISVLAGPGTAVVGVHTHTSGVVHKRSGAIQKGNTTSSAGISSSGNLNAAAATSVSTSSTKMVTPGYQTPFGFVDANGMGGDVSGGLSDVVPANIPAPAIAPVAVVSSATSGNASTSAVQPTSPTGGASSQFVINPSVPYEPSSPPLNNPRPKFVINPSVPYEPTSPPLSNPRPKVQAPASQP